MFIDALGEVASADALEVISDEGVAAVPAAALSVDMLASAALVAGAALSLLELMALPVVELDALLSMALLG